MTRTKMAKSSNHWYDVSGSEIISAHDADLRQARKRNLYASPTTVEKSIRANPMLARWLTKEIVRACDENPRFANEELDYYVRRIDGLSGKIAGDASDFGTRLHAVLEEYPSPAADQSLQPYWDAFHPWFQENFSKTLHTEVKLADHRIGICGTCDFIGLDHEGNIVINDYKTSRRADKADFYNSWARQLSFYRRAYSIKMGLSVLPKCMSTIIDSQNPNRPIHKTWDEEEMEQAEKEFMCHAFLWSVDKNYFPCGLWSPEFSFTIFK